MSDIRKRTGKKGITYQVRYPSSAAKTGYVYKTFSTMKEARAFVESGKAFIQGSEKSYDITTIEDAVQKWLDICEKLGRDGREKVEPVTLEDYRRRARVGEPPLKWSAWRVQMSPFSGGPRNGRETTEAGGNRLEAASG